MKENRLKDPLTGELFIPKRVNQRFASAINRNKFNNRMANELRKERDKINAPLNKTHRKLSVLMKGKDEAIFSKEYLKGYGVELNLFNHIVRIDNIGHHAVFEFVIILNGKDNTVKIIRYGRY